MPSSISSSKSSSTTSWTGIIPTSSTFAKHGDHISRLERLPANLIQRIAKDHLTPADAASWVLSDPKILYAVGIWPLTFSEHDKAVRKDLLMRIAKDSPYWYFCHDSFDLHEVATMEPAWEFRHYGFRDDDESKYQRLKIRVYVGDFEECAMRFCYLEQAMKRYYHGAPHGIPIERLRLSYVRVNSEIMLHSAEPRIISTDSGAALGLKTQSWFLYGSPYKEPSSYSVMFGHSQHLVICDHILNNDDDMIELVVHQERVCGGRPIDLCCAICELVFQLDVKPCGINTKALVLTKWMNLGAGRDVNDPDWQRHVNRDWGQIKHPDGALGRGYWYHTPRALMVKNADTTRRWYEGTLHGDDYTGIDLMTKRNEQCLVNREYLDARKGPESKHSPSICGKWYELKEDC